VISWRCVPFAELTPRELHDILQARAAVFVVEQHCAFQDVDGADPHSWHLSGHVTPSPALPQGGGSQNVAPLGEGQNVAPLGEGQNVAPSPLGEGRGGGRLVAYCRLVPPGTKFAEPSIGRVITPPSSRGAGHGRALMHEALRQAEALWPGRALRIGAQRYLERFYGEFGFVTASAPYDEDGILHVEMVRPASRIADALGQPVGQ
jgi:ElaA protein